MIVAINSNLYLGTYKSDSLISAKYRFLRDVSFHLSMWLFLLSEKSNLSIPAQMIWCLFAFCLGFYYKYLKCNKIFIDQKGEFFLLLVISIIMSTLLFFFAAYNFFWRSLVISSLICFTLAIICSGCAFFFNKKNREYLSSI